MTVKKTTTTKKTTKTVKPKNTSTKKATKVTVKEKEVKPKETPKSVESLSTSGGPKRKGTTKRRATLAAKKKAAMPKVRKPKAIKPKSRWGVINFVNVGGNFHMDYLIGRYVKILPSSAETRLECIVQSPGYEGVQLPFDLAEITEVPSRPSKERMYNAYLTSIKKADISLGIGTFIEDEGEDEINQKTTKKRKKNEQK